MNHQQGKPYEQSAKTTVRPKSEVNLSLQFERFNSTSSLQNGVLLLYKYKTEPIIFCSCLELKNTIMIFS